MSTALPSFLSSPPSTPSAPVVRDTVPAPFHLTERIRTHFEERLYPSALASLSTLLFTGLSSDKPLQLPPPSFLRYTTTLLAHPFYTTQRRKRRIRSTAPELAHRLLIQAILTLRPSNLNLSKSWEFKPSPRGSRRRRGGADDGDTGSPTEPRDADAISGELGNEESLFAVAEDLWAIVGWAFNCSVKHERRWRYWKRVLEVFLVAFREDWNDRLMELEATGREEVLEDALILRFMPDTKGSRQYRRMLEAVFADGEGAAGNAFAPVWQDELMVKRPRAKGRPGLDSVFGQSESDDSADDEAVRGKTLEEVDEEWQPLPSKPKQKTPRSEIEKWGGMDALRMRQEFLVLFSELSEHGLFLDLHTLYLEYSNHLLPLPAPSFVLFTSSVFNLSPHYISTFHRLLLGLCISSAAPEISQEDGLTQDLLIRKYLPYPAKSNSAAENCKVAVLLESLLRVLVHTGMATYSVELEAAVEAGAGERRRKAKKGRGTEAERRWMEVAEKKLKLLVQVLKRKK